MIKILSTKTLSDAQISFLTNKGFDIKCVQFIDFQYLTPDIYFKHNENKNVIFTSQNGVIGFEKIYKGESDLNIFCLEGPTANLAKKFGKILGTAQNSVALAELILREGVNDLSYFKGNLSRPELPEILKKKGVKLNEFEVYQTILKPIEIKEDFDAILFFSPSAVDSFFIKNRIDVNIPCFCIGDKTASALKKYKLKHINSSENSTVFEVLENLVNYFKQKSLIKKNM